MPTPTKDFMMLAADWRLLALGAPTSTSSLPSLVNSGFCSAIPGCGARPRERFNDVAPPIEVTFAVGPLHLPPAERGGERAMDSGPSRAEVFDFSIVTYHKHLLRLQLCVQKEGAPAVF